MTKRDDLTALRHCLSPRGRDRVYRLVHVLVRAHYGGGADAIVCAGGSGGDWEQDVGAIRAQPA
jgi:hypothetical protein